MTETAIELSEQEELALSLHTTDEARRLLDLPIGLHENVTERVYHARVLGMASKSGLDQVRQSPAHYKAWVDGLLERDTQALGFGKAIHQAILEPELFARSYVIAPDFGDCRKRENKLARDAWNKENAHATILRNADGIHMLGMVRAAVAHPLVAALFESGASEATARWDDPETGLPCKCRTDHYRQDLATIVDIKSSSNAKADAFARDVAAYGYHRQDGFYRSGLTALGAPVEHFIFVCIEKLPPYNVAVFEVDSDDAAQGARENGALLRQLAECVGNDVWPGYPPHIQSVRLPVWARERA